MGVYIATESCECDPFYVMYTNYAIFISESDFITKDILLMIMVCFVFYLLLMTLIVRLMTELLTDVTHWIIYIDGLMQDCSNSSALALELLQSCTKPWIYDDEIFQNVSC